MSAVIATTFADRFDTILNMDFDGFIEMMNDAAKQSLDCDRRGEG
jgi:hypothetical protein